MDISWALRSCERLYLFPNRANKSETFSRDPGLARAKTGFVFFQFCSPAQVLRRFSVMARTALSVKARTAVASDAITFTASLSACAQLYLFPKTAKKIRSFQSGPRASEDEVWPAILPTVQPCTGFATFQCEGKNCSGSRCNNFQYDDEHL